MPNRNGTGPQGAGPLTGRGLGPCGRGDNQTRPGNRANRCSSGFRSSWNNWRNRSNNQRLRRGFRNNPQPNNNETTPADTSN